MKFQVVANEGDDALPDLGWDMPGTVAFVAPGETPIYPTLVACALAFIANNL